MDPQAYLSGKKVLVMGLGVHGGGVASAKWLLKYGASVVVTDLRDERELASSFSRFTDEEHSLITFILGEHRTEDIRNSDIIVVNPAVPRESKYLSLARDLGKDIQNDTSLFFRFVTNPIIGVTGTRGKTTTTNWIAALLSTKYGNIIPTGNTPKNALLDQIERLNTNQPVVAELSSWQLELLPHSGKAPHIAVITNIYPDHLNRYEDIKDYATAKAGIFSNQKESDFLILNHESAWRGYFQSKNPRAKLYFTSTTPLPPGHNGVYIQDNAVILRSKDDEKKLFYLNDFSKAWGAHNVKNMLTTILSVYLLDPSYSFTNHTLSLLKQIRYRQETIFNDGDLRIVNDTAATSPDALVSSLKRFAAPTSYFIVGGTDKALPFKECAQIFTDTTQEENVIFLSGSATDKLLLELHSLGFFKSPPQLFENLTECTKRAMSIIGEKKGTLVFSPGAASFEKFANEFDRGEKFESIVNKLLRP